MTISWVVTADAVEAKIYALGKVKGELILVESLAHPEGRWKASEIGSEKPGRSETRMERSSSFEHPNPKETDLLHFVKNIAKALEAGRVGHQFERLVLIAAPHLHGLLRQEMNQHLLTMVHKEIQKDYSKLPLPELYARAIELE